jgi:hypothetical protein
MLKQSPEDYFKKSITVPFLYCTLNEMMADMFLIGRYLRIFFSETAWPGELKLYMKPGVDPETLLTGGFSYGTIFSNVEQFN